MYGILGLLSSFVIGVISALGYAGVVLMMTVESACIPLPSEVIMPFAGYLAASGRFSLNSVAMAGTLGCLFGSYIAYGVGASGGRRVLERRGYLVLISPAELEAADRFFDRWGAFAVFTGRLLPVIRTFIAFPAGVARMRLTPFTIYTILGSYLWCLALAWAGMKLGQNWDAIGPFFRRFDDLIAIAMIAGVSWLVYRRIRSIVAERRNAAAGSHPRSGHG
jgi:membrane protein DedA with SNARE-associated domain